MITIEISGGLGNQMFQYALYLKMKKLNKNVRLDLSEYYQRDAFRKYGLDVFGIKKDNSSYCMGESFGYKVINKLTKYKYTYDEVLSGKVGVFQPEIFEFKRKILRGYWQNERYFSDIADLVRKTYTFDMKQVKKDNILLSDELTKKNSVSVHIRRGDYLNPKNVGVYGQICDKDYYNRAINYIREVVNNCEFYLFSDDIEWTKNNIYENGMHIIDWNQGADSWQDMFLMSKCKHHVIANSTFSWWGAWLGNNEDKIVVAPSRWFANHECIDVICAEWRKC